MGDRQEKRENLTAKIKALRAKQAALKSELEKQFDCQTYRELSILNHKIKTLKERESGGWKNTPPLASIRVIK